MFVTRVLSLPQTYWQGEEIRFARALLTFDPVQMAPDPPGYPLYIAAGRLLNFFIRNGFATLLTLSVVSATIGAWLVATVVAELFGDDWTGAAAAIVLYFSPTMLAFDALPNPEAFAVALIAAALLFWLRGHTIWFGVFAALAVAARPEIAVAMLVLVLFKPRALPAFVVVAVIAFLPLVEAIGPSQLVPYAKVHYAALQTSSAAAGLHARDLALRFIVHPWGSKWISVPRLAFAFAGFFVLVRRDRRLSIALIAFAIVHIAFCIAFADRNAGLQPVVPVLIVIAICAVAAFAEWPRVAIVLASVYAIASAVYAWPLIDERRTSPSPPARAIRFARRLVPREAVLLYEPDMEAWAGLSRLTTAPVRDFDRFVDQTNTPLFLLADGGSSRAHAVHFEWPDSDPYGKITTERYRVTSLIPFPPPSRFRSLGGVYGFERTFDGREWRWLEQDAVIELPRIPATTCRITFALPDDAPIDSNVVTVNGSPVTVTRGRSVTFAIPATTLLRIHAARSFSSERDQRSLAVQLLDIEQR